MLRTKPTRKSAQGAYEYLWSLSGVGRPRPSVDLTARWDFGMFSHEAHLVRPTWDVLRREVFPLQNE